MVDGHCERGVALPLHQPHLNHAAGPKGLLGDCLDALEVGLADVDVADRTLPPVVVGQRQIVEDAGPAERVTAPRDLARNRWEEADGTAGRLTPTSLQIDLLNR